MNEIKEETKKVSYKTREQLNEVNRLLYVYDELRKIAKTLHRSHENGCNFGLSKSQETREWNLIKKAQELANEIGFDAYEQGDPRGCPLYLVTPELKDKYDSYNSTYSSGIAIL